MSQHNIIGSEAFTRGPSVIIRKYKAGGMRRRRSKTIATFIAGAGAMLVVGAVLSLSYNTPFVLNAMWVGLGQLGACYALGLPLLWALRKVDFHKA